MVANLYSLRIPSRRNFISIQISDDDVDDDDADDDCHHDDDGDAAGMCCFPKVPAMHQGCEHDSPISSFLFPWLRLATYSIK